MIAEAPPPPMRLPDDDGNVNHHARVFLGYKGRAAAPSEIDSLPALKIDHTDAAPLTPAPVVVLIKEFPVLVIHLNLFPQPIDLA